MNIRGLIRRAMPGLAAERARRHERQLREHLGLPELARRLEPAVASGPFTGLRYPADRLEEVDAPVAKLLGTYECELASIFEEATGPFYDIGSADGYYAVGMALRGHRVIAWDTSANARELCAAVAALNGVTIEQRATYTGEPMSEGLVLVDIEGAERDLLTGRVAAGLPTVLVEVHEDSHPGTSAQLREAFAPTHDARRIEQEPRTRPDSIRGWSEEEQNRALTEFRPPEMHWLLFTRRPR